MVEKKCGAGGDDGGAMRLRHGVIVAAAAWTAAVGAFLWWSVGHERGALLVPLGVGYGVLWLLGLFAIGVGVLYIRSCIRGFLKNTEALARGAQENRLLAAAVEHAGESIMIADIAGVIQYVNPYFESLTGYTRKEILGRTSAILKSGEHDEAFYKGLWETILSGRTWRGTILNKKKDGALYSEKTVISAVHGADEEIVNFVAVKRDITRERDLEKQLRRSERLQSIGQLAGGVAHDFNNILTSILGNCSFLIQDLAAGEAKVEDVEAIRADGERAAQLTRQLLAFSCRQAMKPKVLNLNAAIARMSKFLLRLLREDIKMTVLPGSELGSIRADPTQIEQVIMNLIVNARDAMPDGGKLTVETVNVDLDEHYICHHPEAKPGPHVMLAVSDEGSGMGEKTLGRIFEPFFTTKDAGKGTGLGLAAVYGIVKQSGGSIQVYSELGRGTAFKIYFPRVDEEPAEKRLRPARDARGTETVLLAEDDDQVRRITARELRRQGYTVLEARSGEEALEIDELHPGDIDLLLTDIVMPKVKGPELAKRIMSSRPKLKVVFLSGYAQGNGDAGNEIDFLHKPYALDTLTMKVRAILDRDGSDDPQGTSALGL